MTTNNVAIVIPALNEEEALSHLLTELPADLAQWIIVVDNNSIDATAAVARGAGALVVNEPLRGYGQACWRGCKAAAEVGAEILMFMDGDGSDDPADLPEMLEPFLADRADLVMGLRVSRRSEPGAIPAQARLGNYLVSHLLNLIYGAHLHDIGSFRVLRRDALEALQMREMTSGWPVEMLVKAVRARYRIVEVPQHYRRRRHGRSKVTGTLVGSVKAAYCMLWTTARYARRSRGNHV